MASLNDCINEYTTQLRKGEIQKAYKGIMTFMSGLKNYMGTKHPEYSISGLYFGYMDMTYFAFTPMELKNKKLKIAVVYLHGQNRFEVWLGGSNRKVQAEFIEMLNRKDLCYYKVSEAGPGVDSIIEMQIADQPDFEQPEELMQKIEDKTMEFANNVMAIIT